MHVFLIAAVTKDGYIARSPHDRSFDWNSPEDKQFYIDKIKSADALIMGITTFKTFTKYPKGKTYVILTHHPDEFVNPKPQVIHTIPTAASPQEIIEDLKSRGFQTVAIAGGSSVYTQFMESGLVDTVYLTQENITFGSGIPLFAHPMEDHLELTQSYALSLTTHVLEYAVNH